MYRVRGATSQVMGKQPPTTDFEPRGSCSDPKGAGCLDSTGCPTQTHAMLMVAWFKGDILHDQRRALPQVLWLVPSPHISALKSSKAYPVPPIFGAAPSAVHLGQILRPVQIRRPDDSVNIFDLGLDQKPAEPLTIQVHTQVLNTT